MNPQAKLFVRQKARVDFNNELETLTWQSTFQDKKHDPHSETWNYLQYKAGFLYNTRISYSEHTIDLTHVHVSPKFGTNKPHFCELIFPTQKNFNIFYMGILFIHTDVGIDW